MQTWGSSFFRCRREVRPHSLILGQSQRSSSVSAGSGDSAGAGCSSCPSAGCWSIRSSSACCIQAETVSSGTRAPPAAKEPAKTTASPAA
ncbi:hypothetical protein ACFFX0_32005 [Citricoccus parietis]|uniref:Uncharacterized protein n=1 Tax=Citricoccus parietis TaxID=592307 RepID=A0ABV5G9A0_9MICC